MTELNMVKIREALEEADGDGRDSPEWQYIRYLVTRLDDDALHVKFYRAGWRDAFTSMRGFLDRHDSS